MNLSDGGKALSFMFIDLKYLNGDSFDPDDCENGSCEEMMDCDDWVKLLDGHSFA